MRLRAHLHKPRLLPSLHQPRLFPLAERGETCTSQTDKCRLIFRFFAPRSQSRSAGRSGGLLTVRRGKFPLHLFFLSFICWFFAQGGPENLKILKFFPFPNPLPPFLHLLLQPVEKGVFSYLSRHDYFCRKISILCPIAQQMQELIFLSMVSKPKRL